MDESVDFSVIARMASGASGAEIANIINEAALRAVRENRKYVTQSDLEESIEVVIAGYQKKNAILTDQEKKVVSYHEIGHALVAAKQTNSAPVQKITIVPRTSGALGYTMQVDEGNHYLMSQEELENKIATLTGGRAAEETQAEIDRQVVDLVKKQHQKALRILEENREKLDELAGYLYEKETITGEEFMDILNK